MSLSDFAYYVRKFGPIAVLGFMLFIVFFAIIRSLLGIVTAPEPEVTVYQPPFGILAPITFTHSIDYPDTFSMTIDNIEGRPITTIEEAPVFFVPSTRTRFGYQQTIALMARAVGIDTEEHSYVIEDTTATYKDSLKTLTVDIKNFNFDYELDITKVPTLFDDIFIPSETKIKEEAKAFMRQMDKFPPELAQGTQNIIYLRYDAAEDDFVVVESPDEANVVEVDFFVPDIEEHPAVSPRYFNSHIYVTLVFREEGNVIIKSSVKDFPPDYTNTGKYPVKTGDQAWSELQNRQGAIVSPSKGTTDIVVRDMFIGYYFPDEYAPYLMPVYVFLGDNGFAAYVSAIDNQYIQGDTPAAE